MFPRLKDVLPNARVAGMRGQPALDYFFVRYALECPNSGGGDARDYSIFPVRRLMIGLSTSAIAAAIPT